MDAASDLAAILRELDAGRAETLRRLDGLTQEQLDWRPPGGAGEAAWSLGEVYMHLAIDEYYLGDQLGRFWLEGDAPPHGERSLPPPPHGVMGSELRGLFADTRTRTHNLIATWLTAPEHTLRPDRDQAAMQAAGWLAAYGRHEALHRRQIEALIAQMALHPS